VTGNSLPEAGLAVNGSKVVLDGRYLPSTECFSLPVLGLLEPHSLSHRMLVGGSIP